MSFMRHLASSLKIRGLLGLSLLLSLGGIFSLQGPPQAADWLLYLLVVVLHGLVGLMFLSISGQFGAALGNVREEEHRLAGKQARLDQSVAAFEPRFDAWSKSQVELAEQLQELQDRLTNIINERLPLIDQLQHATRDLDQRLLALRSHFDSIENDETITERLKSYEQQAGEVQTEMADLRNAALAELAKMDSQIQSMERDITDRLQLKGDHLESRFDHLKSQVEQQSDAFHVKISNELNSSRNLINQEWEGFRKNWESRYQLEREHADRQHRDWIESTEARIQLHLKELEQGYSVVKTKYETLMSALGALKSNWDKEIQVEIAKERDARNAAFARRDKKWFQNFNRVLADADEAHFFTHWNNVLGTSVQRSHLRYLQQKISEIESICTGRLACSVQQAILNLLLVRSVKGDHLTYLEIGTLFGINTIVTHQISAQWFDKVHFVMIDPLEGYYTKSPLDPTTGMQVSRATLEQNLKKVGLPKSDYSIIQKYSSDPEALAQAGQRAYDVIFIDGDHSFEGVRDDFKHYSGMVKEGGYLVFDDYGEPSWPGVTEFVDSHVKKTTGFREVGSGWNTIIFVKESE